MDQCCSKYKFTSSSDVGASSRYVASTSSPRGIVTGGPSTCQVDASSANVTTTSSPREVDASSMHVAITSLPSVRVTSSTCKILMSTSHESVAATSHQDDSQNLVSTSPQADSQVLQGAATYSAGKTSKPGGHTMISYNWTDAKEIAHKVSDELQNADLPVWIDKEKMRGNMYERMAEAVENANGVIICMSSNYEKSANCKREASMAADLKKRIIPIHVQDGYKAGGWLRTITAGILYHDFREGSFEENFKELFKDIVGGEDREINQQGSGENVKTKGERLCE